MGIPMKKRNKKLNDNYIVIQSWMVSELGLKGNQLIIYALVYGFSQAEEQVCTCGVEYMRKWLNGAKSTVIRTLNELQEMNLIRREEGQDEDGRVMGYTAIRPEKLGSELLPNSDEKGSKTRPKLGSKMRPNSEKIGSNLQRIGSNLLPVNIIKINNIQTDKSVCQSTRACAREDGTDGQTEKEFYAECVFANWKRLKSELWGEEDIEGGCEYDKRLGDVVKELLRRETVTVNGVELTATDMLKTVNELFADTTPETLLSALVSGCAPEIKKKFNYTVTALYNAAKQF